MKRCLLVLLQLLSIGALAQPVSLDPGFANGGMLTVPNTTEINRMAFGSDGSIFGAGYTIQGGGSGIYHLTLLKTRADGQPDPGFGTNGIATATITYSETPYAVLVQPDGKILVAGSA